MKERSLKSENKAFFENSEKIMFFIYYTTDLYIPPGGWGGVWRSLGFKASVSTFYLDLSPMG